MKRVLCLLLALILLLSLGTQALAEEALYCRICGRQIPADSNVCPYCGEKVVFVESSTNIKTALSGDSASSSTATAAEVGTGTKSVPVSRISAPSPATAEAPTPGPFNTTMSAAGTPTLGKVRVTKSPTSESVPYGGSCMFIAHAVNATSVTWYIANADTSLITTAAEAPSHAAGLYVSGENTDTLVLSGIPSWMNGCRVQACFTGEGGPVYSETATIWIYEPEPVNKWDPYKDLDWWTLWQWTNTYRQLYPKLWETQRPTPRPRPAPTQKPIDGWEQAGGIHWPETDGQKTIWELIGQEPPVVNTEEFEDGYTSGGKNVWELLGNWPEKWPDDVPGDQSEEGEPFDLYKYLGYDPLVINTEEYEDGFTGVGKDTWELLQKQASETETEEDSKEEDTKEEEPPKTEDGRTIRQSIMDAFGIG